MEKYYYYCNEDISLIENYEKAKADTGRIMSEEARNKITEDHKGCHWFTNGTENRFCFECPEGFVKGLTRNKERI